MVAKGKIRGHEMVRDESQWRYVDTGELVSSDRPCGHGNQEESYIQFENGFTVRGFVIDGPPSDSE